MPRTLGARHDPDWADRPHGITLGAHRGCDAADFVEELCGRPHLAQNKSSRRSAIDQRRTLHPGHTASQRKRIEEAYGWIKAVAAQARPRSRGLAEVDWASAAYNLGRARKLVAAAP